PVDPQITARYSPLDCHDARAPRNSKPKKTIPKAITPNRPISLQVVSQRLCGYSSTSSYDGRNGATRMGKPLMPAPKIGRCASIRRASPYIDNLSAAECAAVPRRKPMKGSSTTAREINAV